MGIKRFAFLVVFYMIFSLPIISQTTFAISGGATSANFNYQEEIQNQDYNNDNKIGLNGGIKLDIPLGKKKVFRLTPELFINQNGTKDEYYTSYTVLIDSLRENRVSLDYIGLYFPFKINIQSDKGTGVYFLGSVYADYTIAAHISNNLDISKKVEFNSEKDKLDYGYRFAIGLLFTESVGIEIGYNKGLKDIEFSTQINSTNTNYIVNNKGLTVSLMVFFE